MDCNNRQYVVFNATEVNKIDFSQVMETSADTLRYSIDGTKTFVKYEGEQPQCIAELTTKDCYCYYDMLNLMQTEEWQNLDALLTT